VTRFEQDSTGPFVDRVGRVGIVLDTRDVEMDPHRGVFAEALAASGRGYARTSAALRLYAHPLERLILAARVGRETITGTAPLAVQQTIETSEGPLVALGGARSLRGYYDGRFVGPGKIVFGFEARYGLLWAPRLLEVKLVRFLRRGTGLRPWRNGAPHAPGTALGPWWRRGGGAVAEYPDHCASGQRNRVDSGDLRDRLDLLADFPNLDSSPLQFVHIRLKRDGLIRRVYAPLSERVRPPASPP